MNLEVVLELAAPPSLVWPHVERLDRYPPWMRLVHRAEVSTAVAAPFEQAAPGDSGPDVAPVWEVELRARIGPFARSKRLRMVRTVHEPERRVRFERAELDGRDHADWTLDTTLDDTPSGASLLTAQLRYGGELWTGGILERVLQDEIRRAKAALTQLVSPAPTP